MLDPRKPKTPYNENRVVTVLGPGTVVSGGVRSKGTVRVEAFVEGDVSSEDCVVLLDSGRVKGNVSAGRVIVGGEIHGNVTAAERIEITQTGRVTGDLCAPRISIHEGVLFEGRCVMKPAPQNP
ncbi:MAG: polymer-forming cytoskeletal protein [Candidatus Hydrogenedens sp.]|nr:polymer-forming cytoskeletal protein [Candidatus Hydrogenedentota bacterium]NLF58031.1 polymer-forming cytoskeletal protein [Candidatus Hydrogenedens sp.]